MKEMRERKSSNKNEMAANKLKRQKIKKKEYRNISSHYQEKGERIYFDSVTINI